MPQSIYKNNLRANFTPGDTLPKISTKLDSVRSYQFECRFFGVPDGFDSTDLTAAAKQVSPIAGQLDDIVVDRVNDKMYYPGKFTPEAVTITFDNQLLSRTTPMLWEWFKTIYDPLTGDVSKLASPGGAGNRSFKASKLTIMELDNTNEPHAFVELYGVYPQAVSFSEKNYSTNDFSTIEVTFRYDFVDYGKYS
jgi:hypothetical protein